jgi:glycosyltransferase involved in cell wall biosynthesis
MKKKILMVVPSMNGGGSERVMSIIANYLDRDKFIIILVLLKNEGVYLKDLEKDIDIIDLKSTKIRYSVIKLFKLIKDSNPDIVFSTLGSLNLILVFLKPLFKNTKFVARESSIVSIKNKKEKYPKLYDWLYKSFYNRFDLIVCQSEFMQKDMIENYHIRRTIVINNPVDIKKIELLANQNRPRLFLNNKINLLAVGRLHKVKGFDKLLEVISKLSDKYHLTIIGSGTEEKKLKELAIELSVHEKVTFLGFQSNPYKYMARADVMLLSSQYEGFPNVILESNACGVPVIAFDCPGGTREIIINGVNGYLTESGDVPKLLSAIKFYDKSLFDKENIIFLVKKKYELSYIINQYEVNFLKIL